MHTQSPCVSLGGTYRSGSHSIRATAALLHLGNQGAYRMNVLRNTTPVTFLFLPSEAGGNTSSLTSSSKSSHFPLWGRGRGAGWLSSTLARPPPVLQTVANILRMIKFIHFLVLTWCYDCQGCLWVSVVSGKDKNNCVHFQFFWEYNSWLKFKMTF